MINSPDVNEVEREEARGELDEILAWARKYLRGTKENEQRQVRAIRQGIRRLLLRLSEARDPEGAPDKELRGFGEHLERFLWEPSSRGGRRVRLRVSAALAGRFTAVVSAWRTEAISRDTMLERLKRGEVLLDGRSVAQERALIHGIANSKSQTADKRT